MRKGLRWFSVGLAGLMMIAMAATLVQAKVGTGKRVRGMSLAPLVNDAKVQQELSLSADQIERLRQLQHNLGVAGIVEVVAVSVEDAVAPQTEGLGLPQSD